MFASIKSGSLFLSLVFLSHKPRYHDLANRHITMMHLSAVDPLEMKARCALCREFRAYSAACSTAKIETKKSLMIGEDMYGLPSHFV